MPTKTVTPVIVTTATAEIIDEHRLGLLGNKLKAAGNNDIFDLPIPPKDDFTYDHLAINTSAGTTASTANTPSPSISPGSTQSNAGTPSKKKVHHNHQNNSQGDVNSIESISEHKPKYPSTDLDWLDDICPVKKGKGDNNGGAMHKKKKKSRTTAKELDQLDGLTGKILNNGREVAHTDEVDDEDDDKLVKCLYFTLMCCDCSIS